MALIMKLYLGSYLYPQRGTPKEDMIDYMDFYNYRRFHETLKYKKPMSVYFESLQINDENYTENVVTVS